MAWIFKEGRVNFPKDDDEFKARLAAIKKLINNDDNIANVNVEFVKTAFKFMEDCGLITEKIADSLTDAEYCAQFSIKFPYLRTEGALRAVNNDDDVFDENDMRRFYSGATSLSKGSKMHVELLNGQHYLISNDWYAGNYNNKANFFRWLELFARAAWRNHKSAEKNSAPAKNLILVPANDFKYMLELMKSLHNKVDNLTAQIEEIKNMRK